MVTTIIVIDAIMECCGLGLFTLLYYVICRKDINASKARKQLESR
jgi:hypothetical protein